jgi:hypothetical protein
MFIAKIGDTIEVGDYRQLFPNTSFPASGPSSQFMVDNGCLPVNLFKDHDRMTQKLSQVAPYVENNEVFTVQVESLTEDEIASATSNKASQMRSSRNRLLADCDWTQISDATVDKAIWATYRQELRDISSQVGFPWEITWPTQPE